MTDFRKNIIQRAAVNPNKRKASGEIGVFCRQYFETVGAFKTGIHDILAKYGFYTQEFDDWNIVIPAANVDLNVTIPQATARQNFEIAPKAFLSVNVYRMDSGKYEVNAYIS